MSCASVSIAEASFWLDQHMHHMHLVLNLKHTDDITMTGAILVVQRGIESMGSGPNPKSDTPNWGLLLGLFCVGAF